MVKKCELSKGFYGFKVGYFVPIFLGLLFGQMVFAIPDDTTVTPSLNTVTPSTLIANQETNPPSSIVTPSLTTNTPSTSMATTQNDSTMPIITTVTPVISNIVGTVFNPFLTTLVIPSITQITAVPLPDADMDGISDDIDNCPTTFNPSQTNHDGDAMGDACDPNTEIIANTVAVDTTFGGDLTVDGATFTIPSGITVEFDFVNNKITVKAPDGKILVQLGGKIT